MYRIIGADGKEYGPISKDQMRQWMAEGRVNNQTRVLLEGTTEWKTVADMPELTAPAPSAVGAVPPPPMTGLPPMGAIPTMTSGYPSSNALEQVNGPGIGLIVTGAITVLLSLGFLIVMLAGIGLGAMQSSSSEAEKIFAGFAGSLGVALRVVGILGGLIVLYGGIKMRKLENYGLCMTASIVAMIPCLSCCIIGLPIGIWSLVVLSKPEVKNFFR
jgi:hypothetical protein